MKKPLLVLKVGTASITRADGSLDQPVMVDLVRQMAALHPQYRLLLVSSGAVGTGRRFIPGFSGSITDRKAAAAIGNPLLMQMYSRFFAPYDIHLAQTLCERHHFSNRTQFLQLRETIETLWEQDIIPIANENDVVSNLELKFSDNDELATLMAVGLGAEKLLICTAVPGLLDQAGEVVPTVEKVDRDILGLAHKKTSKGGLGGMISKLTFARLATGLGIKVIIFGAQTPDGLRLAVAEETGTVFLPQERTPRARQKWLASGSLVAGRLQVDEGAFNALQKRKTLLAVGIEKVVSAFEAGEVVELVQVDGLPFAVARARIGSAEIPSPEQRKNLIIAHADDIVLL
ncbi:MAG: glutamate 5-kinase [Bacteroidota bacterium]